MIGQESLDIGYDVFHSQMNKRDSTRTSRAYFEGEVPILPERAESRTVAGMVEQLNFDVAKLRRVVIEHTGQGKKWSRRALSLAASNGKNPDLVRDFISRGQDRKPSFDAVAGIANALGMDVSEFTSLPSLRAPISNMPPRARAKIGQPSYLGKVIRAKSLHSAQRLPVFCWRSTAKWLNCNRESRRNRRPAHLRVV